MMTMVVVSWPMVLLHLRLCGDLFSDVFGANSIARSAGIVTEPFSRPIPCARLFVHIVCQALEKKFHKLLH